MIEQHFTLERIGEILNRNPGTMRSHINRGYVVGKGPRDASKEARDKGEGKHERFSIYTLIEFAFGYRIGAAGINLKQAFQYGAQFAHAGGTDFTNMNVCRLPSLPFHYRHGPTYMGMMAGKSIEISGAGKPDFASFMYHLQRMTNSSGGEPMIVIDATEVFVEVCTALGTDYRDVLTEAYGG